MILHLFSLTITITKKKVAQQTAIHNAQAKEMLEKTHQKAFEHHRMRRH